MINGDYILIKAPLDYPGKKYRNLYCYEHHLQYWKHYNKIITREEVIHHINGNKHDNRIENLELISKIKHAINHARKRGVSYLKIKCPICSKIFNVRRRASFIGCINSINPKRKKFTTCSHKCSGKLAKMDKTLIKMMDYVLDNFKKYS